MQRGSSPVWPLGGFLAGVQGGGDRPMQGVPDLPGAPQDEAGLMRKFET